MEFIVGIIVAALVILLLTLYSSLTWGLVLYKFWYWFLLPVFPMLPEITYILAVGLFMFSKVLNSYSSTPIKEEYKNKDSTYLSIFLTPWLLLLMGWIIKLFVL